MPEVVEQEGTNEGHLRTTCLNRFNGARRHTKIISFLCVSYDTMTLKANAPLVRSTFDDLR